MGNQNPETGKSTITVYPWGLRVKADKGTTLLQALFDAGIQVESPCGGRGTCGKCTLKVIPAAQPGSKEEEVLACQTTLENDLIVTVPQQEETTDMKSVLSSLDTERELDSSVKIHSLDISSSVDSYEEELLRQLPEGTRLENRLEILQNIAPFSGKRDITLQGITVNNVLVDINKDNTPPENVLGVAIDLGTTTVMGSLMDLTDGSSLGTVSHENQQKIGGADVISRSSYAMEQEDGLETLQQKTKDTINGIIDDLLEKASARREDIWETIIVGNTTMLHLFWGILPQSLVLAPYQPVLRKELNLSSGDLMLHMNPRGRVYTIPCVSSYVGADALSAVMATRLHHGDKPRLLIDIGTNGEMVMGCKDRLVACSTAAGPAFEGARIRQGMRGTTGAIEKVEIEGETVKNHVIGKEKPRGICGSGLLDAVAALYQAGVITKVGKFSPADSLPSFLRERLVEGETGTEFLLALPEESSNNKGVSLNRQDIGELQLAKGAIAAGIKILLKKMDIEMEDLEEVLLAGAFGNYLRKESASAIGLWPSYPVEKVRSVGNAAGIGAQMLLLSGTLRREAESLHKKIEHINLGKDADFSKEFSSSMMLKSEL